MLILVLLSYDLVRTVQQHFVTVTLVRRNTLVKLKLRTLMSLNSDPVEPSRRENRISWEFCCQLLQVLFFLFVRTHRVLREARLQQWSKAYTCPSIQHTCTSHTCRSKLVSTSSAVLCVKGCARIEGQPEHQPLARACR